MYVSRSLGVKAGKVGTDVGDGKEVGLSLGRKVNMRGSQKEAQVPPLISSPGVRPHPAGPH